MIVLNLAMMQDQAIDLLEEHGYRFVEKQGIKLFFETPTTDKAADAKAAKDLIKASSFGAALFFNAEVVS